MNAPKLSGSEFQALYEKLKSTSRWGPDGLARRAVCEELRRWSFLCVIAPLRLRAGTGSPVKSHRDLLVPSPEESESALPAR
jgi:hypothetical protein